MYVWMRVQVVDREVEVLSGGELQRFTIGVVVVQRADVYMFDEPSSYLDVKQRHYTRRTTERLSLITLVLSMSD